MLRELNIRNFAIIEDLSISFDDGLTVLTGETGAGKSIIINAINLLLGSRAAPELIRSSQEAAELEALFDVPPDSPAAKAAQAQGIDVSEGLIVRRCIHREGRHKVYLNARLATANTLSQINESLAGIAGQHAHQTLLKPENQLLLLDQFGALAALRGEVGRCYDRVLPLLKRLDELKTQVAEQSQRRELLEFQCDEIGTAGVAPGEDEALEQERNRLRHAERLYEGVGRSVERLYGARGAVVEQLVEIGRELEALGKIDSAVAAAAKRIETTCIELEDVASELTGYGQRIVADSERLEWVERRLDALSRLKRKYGGSLSGVLIFFEEAQRELARVFALPEEIEKTQRELEELHERLSSLCTRLSGERALAAERLSLKVQEELSSLGMTNTRFEVVFKPVPLPGNRSPYLISGSGGIESTGTERAEFFIAPNVGEDLRPLAQIASGGELSRMILALKVILAAQESVQTLIFDEVDAGIGGAVAEMVGEKLAALSRHHQIICITHLPQIARFGKAHYRILKGTHKGRTRTSIARLEGEDRVSELARMLAGVHVTEKALEHAKEMLSPHRS